MRAPARSSATQRNGAAANANATPNRLRTSATHRPNNPKYKPSTRLKKSSISADTTGGRSPWIFMVA